MFLIAFNIPNCQKQQHISIHILNHMQSATALKIGSILAQNADKSCSLVNIISARVLMTFSPLFMLPLRDYFTAK